MCWQGLGVKIDGLAQDCGNSSASALELPKCCVKPSKWCCKVMIQYHSITASMQMTCCMSKKLWKHDIYFFNYQVLITPWGNRSQLGWWCIYQVNIESGLILCRCQLGKIVGRVRGTVVLWQGWNLHYAGILLKHDIIIICWQVIGSLNEWLSTRLL